MSQCERQRRATTDADLGLKAQMITIRNVCCDVCVMRCAHDVCVCLCVCACVLCGVCHIRKPVVCLLRIWFASHQKPVTGIPEINLGELETGNKNTLI